MLPLLALITLLTLYLYYTRHSFRHFRRKRIPHIPPAFPFGNGWPLISGKKPLPFVYQDFYNNLKSRGLRYGGIYILNEPILVSIDPKIAQAMFVSDFDCFVDRGLYVNAADDPLSVHMFNQKGNVWRKMRLQMVPLFTTGRMKHMFESMLKCSEPVSKILDELSGKNEAFDVQKFIAYYSTDSIGSYVYGVDCNSFYDPEHKFYKYGTRAQGFTPLERFKWLFTIYSPKFSKFLHVRLTPNEVEDFFTSVAREAMSYRKQAGRFRSDFIQLFSELIENNSITFEEVAAQLFIAFIGGFESTATTGAYCLYELASNEDIQEKLRSEILEVLEKNDFKLTYKAIMEMEYMDQVIDETLRKYPPFGVFKRICTKDFTIPGTDTIIKEGEAIAVPTLAYHHDPEFFPKPDVFDPERFNEENRKNIYPFSYLPFSDGPMKCPAFRFGRQQLKICLSEMLRSFRFTLDGRTSVPLTFDAKHVILFPEGGIWLHAEKIESTD